MRKTSFDEYTSYRIIVQTTMVFRSVRYFLTVCSSLAIALNLILSPIILFNKNKDIGSYKYLLLSYTTVAFFYSLITLLTLPIYSTNHYGWLFYANTDYFSQYFGAWLLVVFGACFIMITIIIVYSFSYRYANLCKPRFLEWFQQPGKIATLVIAFFAITLVIQSFVAVYFLPTDEMTYLLMLDFHDTTVNLTYYPYIGVPMFLQDGSFAPQTLATMGLWGILMVSSSSIIIFVITNMIKSFKRTSGDATLSPKLIRLQKKLFFLLIFQTLVPVVFSFSPTLLGYGLGYLRYNGAEFSQFYSSLLPIAQVIDPLLIFTFVRDYRMSLLKFFCPKVAESMRSSIITPHSATTHPTGSVSAVLA